MNIANIKRIIKDYFIKTKSSEDLEKKKIRNKAIEVLNEDLCQKSRKKQ